MKKRVYISVITLLVSSIVILLYLQGPKTLFNSSVERIGVEQTSKLMKAEDLVIIDARSATEYETSHIKNAIHKDRFDPSLISKDSEILIYCTVGIRSNGLASELSDQGFKNINDLRSGILGWANSGNELVDNQNTKTDKVHVYSKFFGRFLNKGTAVYP